MAETLADRGFSTAPVGKWHLTAEDEMNLASTRRSWPLGRGFDRYYGFLCSRPASPRTRRTSQAWPKAR